MNDRTAATTFRLAYCVCIALLSSVVAAPATAADKIEVHSPAVTEAARKQLIGNWYGDQFTKDGSHQRWLIKRTIDGAYVAVFEALNASGKLERQSEMGMWGIRYPIYFTAVQAFRIGGFTEPADSTDATLYDAYRVVKLDDRRFRYESYTSGTVFEMRRVADDFTLDSSPPSADSAR